jgi:fibronectin-binding autotransporter adhesin
MLKSLSQTTRSGIWMPGNPQTQTIMSLRAFQQRCLLSALPVAALLLPSLVTAQSTWLGTTSTAWDVATNWNPGVPAAGVNIIISDTTTNNLVLGASTTIGSLTFGAAGLRTANFSLNTQAANTLTLHSGLIASGGLNSTALTLNGHYIVAQNQTWAINGTATGGDQGVFVREAATGVAGRGSLRLDANLTKSGTGQLVVAAIDLSGPGDLVVNEGLLKLNAGASQPLVIEGPGNIVLNGSSTLGVFKNSGTFAVSRPIIMNGTATLQARNNTVDLASPIVFNGNHTVDTTVITNLTGDLSGSGTVNRIGTGTLNLTGDLGGFTGTLNANGGTTVVNSDFGGSIAVGPGATLGGEATIAGNVTFNSGTLNVDGGTSASLSVDGDVVLAGSNSVGVYGLREGTDPLTVLTYGGTLTGDVSTLDLVGGIDNYRNAEFSDATPGSVTLAVDKEDLVWNGGSDWDVRLSSNWVGGDSKFYQLDAVTFGDAGAGTVAIQGVLMPSQVTFDSSEDYVITAQAGNYIAGATGLTKAGTGRLWLGGINAFTGGVHITAGTLLPSGSQVLGPNGQIIKVSGEGTLDVNGAMTTNRGYHADISGAGVGGFGAIVNTGAENQNAFQSLSLSGDATVGGTGRWDVRGLTPGAAWLDLGGFTLTKVGTNHVAFVDGVSDSSGSFVIDEGSFSFTRSLVSGEGSVTVNNNAILWFENNTSGSFNKPIVLNDSSLRHTGANFTLHSNITLAGNTVFRMGSGNTMTLAGSITGPGNLEKTEAGVLQLIAPNSYEGSTVITAGSIQIGNGGSLNSQPVELATTASSLIFNRTEDLTFSNVITGSGVTGNDSNPAALTKLGTHTLTLTGASTFTGTIRLAAGAVAIGADTTVLGSGLLDLRGGMLRSSDSSPRSLANPISFSANTRFGSASTGNLLFTGDVNAGGGSKMFTVDNAVTEFSGVIIGTGGGVNTLTKAGAGTLIFSGDNTYTHTTTISAGTLQVGNGGSTGTLGSSAVINNASLVINRTMPEGVTEISFNNIISGSGSVTHAGPAFTILAADNTYTGDTIITDGTLSPSVACLADGAAVRISGNGKLDLFHGETDTVNSLYINGVPQSAGIWGGEGSGAQFETPYLSGSGLLEVTTRGSVATPYDDWAAGKGLTEANNGPTSDPDNDLRNNLAEFAMDGDPLSGSDGERVFVKVAQVGGIDALTLTLPVRSGVGVFSGTTSLSGSGDGVTYHIEGSYALGPWTLGIEEVVGGDATAIQADLPALRDGWVYRTFRNPGAVSEQPRGFMRARFE